MKSPARKFRFTPPAALVSSKSRSPDCEGDAFHRMPFVKMSAAAQDDYRRAAEGAKKQFAGVSADRWFEKAGDFGVRHFFLHAQFGENMVKSAAEDEGERGAQSGD